MESVNYGKGERKDLCYLLFCMSPEMDNIAQHGGIGGRRKTANGLNDIIPPFLCSI